MTDGESYFKGGSVTIGHTTSTGASLAICDGANAQIQFFPEISTDTNLTQHYDITSGTYMNAETRSASHSFKIGTTEKMRIDSAGSVGIGVSSLESWATSYTALQLGGIASIFATTSPSSGGNLLFGNNIYRDENDSRLEFIIDGPAGHYAQSDGTHRWFVSNTTGSADGNYDTNKVEAITILNTGKVGIGTTSPAEKLGVAGSGHLAPKILYMFKVQELHYPKVIKTE